MKPRVSLPMVVMNSIFINPFQLTKEFNKLNLWYDITDFSSVAKFYSYITFESRSTLVVVTVSEISKCKYWLW